MGYATLRVQFGNPDGSGTNGHLSAEIDTRPDGLNGGRITFSPGEIVHILVYKTPNVSITEALCSAGSLTVGINAAGWPPGQTVTVHISEDLMFEDSNTATLGKPANPGTLQATWMGRHLGSLTLQPDGQTVKAESKGVAVARVSYDAQALVYALASPASINGGTDFSILALIRGVAA